MTNNSVSPESPLAQPRGTRTVSAPTRPRRNETTARPVSPRAQASVEGVGGLAADGPRVVALGGGHGLANVLMAVRRYASAIDAVVSIADDGGSSGRLRREYGAVPPGDIRRCLMALANGDDRWRECFGFRFVGGSLDTHAVGNIMLTALTEQLGSFGAAIEACETLLGAVGHIHPATIDPIVLHAIGANGVVEGQSAIHRTSGLQRLELVGDLTASSQALDAIARADQVIVAPGSLFTSVLPVLYVPEIAQALEKAPGQVVGIGNLVAEIPETEGLGGADHVRLILDHGGRIDTLLVDPAGELPFDVPRIAELGIRCVTAPVASADGRVHDPDGLARALRALL